jgi:hypothetical protein
VCDIMGFDSTEFRLYLVSHTLFTTGLNYMPRGFKVSRLIIANMIPFINISNFFESYIINILTFRVARWDMLDGNLAF